MTKDEQINIAMEKARSYLGDEPHFIVCGIQTRDNIHITYTHKSIELVDYLIALCSAIYRVAMNCGEDKEMLIGGAIKTLQCLRDNDFSDMNVKWN